MSPGFIQTILEEFIAIFMSVPFAAFLIILGSIIYAPTGNRFGKHCLFIGLFLFCLNSFIK